MVGMKFEEEGPTHMGGVIDWCIPNHRTAVIACLVNGAYVQELAHQDEEKKKKKKKKKKKHSTDASLWWTSFHFDLQEQIIDKHDSSIIGCIYRYKPETIPPPSSAPDYVVAFRGTLWKRKTIIEDLKLDTNVVFHRLHKRSRARIALDAVGNLASNDGNGKKIWLAGHSLGSSLAMHVGKNMLISFGVNLETFLFNPPYTDYPIESMIKSEKAKRGIRIVGSLVRAGMVVLMEGQRDKGSENFSILQEWVPNIFVNERDPICAEYKGYFSQRKVLEDAGLDDVRGQATQNSLRALIWTVFGNKDTEPLHLLPSATLVVNLNNYPQSSHSLKQWWSTDLMVESTQHLFPNDC